MAGTGKPGSVHLLTDRFAIVSRNQRAGSHLVEQDERSIRARKAMTNMVEHIHAYLEYGGHLMPFWDRKEPYGVNVVRLVPTGDAAQIVVDFQGYHDPAMYSD